MKDKIFGVLQRVGRSFMLPIAILPVAGLFLGIGGSFTNETMLKAYGLMGVMGPGTPINAFLTVLSNAGDIVFANLPLLFAMGVAIGMAKKEKEVATLSGAIAFLIMHASIGAMININGGTEAMLAGSTASVLGINSLQMGVFGGMIVGLGVAALHNRFYKIELPQVLSFFGGTRFVPIISAITYLFVGILMFYIWPNVQNAIYSVGNIVQSSGYAGTWVYGFMERALIPFGLHHVFYLPFWQTAVGGTAMVGGQLIEGAQNIFFAQLADPSTVQFSVEATRFMSGKFPLMIFGLPGAALAMYKCAKPEKRKVVGGLLLSAALTAMLTGITEPIEFTFLFVAPILYVIHSVFAGAAYMIMHMLNVGVGMTFSGGLIDLTLFGILQGNAKTHWLNIVWVGLIYFAVYYFLFTYLIKKFNFKTPGRDDEEEVKLYTRADVNAKKEGSSGNPSNQDDNISAMILKGLGGRDNLSDLDCCATRLRVTVKDSSKVSESLLKSSGAAGVIIKGNGIQVIYGPRVTVIKSNLEDFIASGVNLEVAADLDTVDTKEEKKEDKIENNSIIVAPIEGNAISLEEVGDGVFSEGMLGKGVAIEPTVGRAVSPVDGVISTVFDTKHAVGLTSDNGVEVLIHIGLDTVKLNGQHFTTHVKAGDKVKAGDLLVEFDIEKIKEAGYPTVTPVIVTNTDSYKDVESITKGSVKEKDKLISVK
ncbi:glucose PTS transporter subunit IIA [Terrisporobacter petrolearius]|uniref:PTS transporter subunit IIABC n=1 Tax=Terrisporobacter petrolearius TaxID=1460447 RepID=UPI001D16DBE0|nr:PTS transporter subunit IIABC [Terrisporobacter petrolearius]MCC3865623.1 glucose PTS transporter subunit IIA [Terrisporobacter petrolearius]